VIRLARRDAERPPVSAAALSKYSSLFCRSQTQIAEDGDDRSNTIQRERSGVWVIVRPIRLSVALEIQKTDKGERNRRSHGFVDCALLSMHSAMVGQRWS
jgi:hypothetical protein